MVVQRLSRPLAALVAVFAFAGVSQAQLTDYTWTGGGGNNLWNNGSNWASFLPGGIPNDGTSNAIFSGAGGGQTNINLAGSPFQLNRLTFDTASAASYNIGGGGGGTLVFSAGPFDPAEIVMNASVVNAQTISGGISLASSPVGVTQNSAATLTVTGIISGANSLTKTGTGRLILTRENTFTGGMFVNGGTLELNEVGGAADTGVLRGTATVNSGGTLLLSSVNALGFGANRVTTLNVNGTGLVDTTAAGDQGWGIAVNMTGGVLRSNGGVSDAAAASYYSLGGGSAVNTLASATTAVVSGRINLREGNAGNTLTFTTADGAAATDLNVTAAVTEGGGARNIAKAGAGVMQLTGLNTYTGTTTVLGGVLSVSDLTIGAASHIGNNDGSAGFLVLNGGTLRYTGPALSTTRGFTVGTAGGGLEANGSGALTVANTAALVLAGTDTARTFTLGGTSTAANTFDALIENNGTGATSLAKAGAGTWVLTNANTYSGTTSVLGGVLSVSADANLGAGTASNTLILNGGTLASTASFTLSTARGIAVGPTAGSGGGTINVAEFTTLSYGGVIANNGGGTGSLTKAGTGTLLLSGNSTYGGATNLTAGVIQINTANALPTGTTLAMSGASLFELNGNDQTLGGLTGASATQIVQNGGTFATLTVNNAAANTFGGVLGTSSANTFALVKGGAGVLTLTGANVYTGSTTILGGVLSASDLTVGAASHIGNNDGSANFLVLNGGTLRYTGAGATTGRLFTLGTAGGTIEANGSGALVFDSTGSVVLTGTDAARTLTLGGTSGGGLVNVLTPILGDNGTGATSVVKAGANTWALAGANTYTGTTSVLGGVLSVSADANLGAGTASNTLTLNVGGTLATTATFALSSARGISLTGTGNGTISVAAGTTLSYAGVIAGPATATLVKAGAGTLVLSGNSTYGGATSLTAGVILLGNHDALPTGTTLAMSGSSELVLNGFNQTVAGLTSSGTAPRVRNGSSSASVLTVNNAAANVFGGVLGGPGTDDNTFAVVKGGAGVLTLTGTNTYAGSTTISAGALSVTADANLGTAPGTATAGHLTLNAGGTLIAGGGFTLNANRGVALTGSGAATFSVAAGTLTYGGIIAGVSTADFTKAGAGTLFLSGANTYAGNTSLTAGVITLGATDALPTTTVLNMTGTSTLNLNGFSQTLAGLTGPANTQRVQNAGAAAVLTVNNAANNTFAGILGNTAANNFAVVKTGAGTLTLGGANTYTGTTTVAAGVLSVAADTNLGTAPATATAGHLTLNAGGTLATTATLTLNPNRGVTLAGSGDATVDVASGTTLTYAGVIGGGASANLTKAGAGTLRLNAANTYAGATNLTAGTVLLGADNALPTTTTLTMTGTGGLELNGFSQTVAGLTGTVDTRVRNTSATAATLTVNNAANNTFAGRLGGSNNFSLVKGVAGSVLTLTADNTYTGTTTVAAGVLQIGDGGTTGTLGGGNVTVNDRLWFNRSNTYTVANAIGGTGSVEQNGTGTTVLTANNTYAGTTSINAGTLQVGDGGTTGTLGGGGVGNNGTLVFNRSDDVTVANALSGSGGIVKNGGNVLTVTGSNSVTGTTTANAGTLLVNSSLAAVVVNSGATLGGTGGVSNVTATSGATVRAGDATAAGTLTLAGSLTMSGGSILGVRITTAGDGAAANTGGSTDAGGVHNKIAGGGSATLNSLLNVLVDVTGSTFTYNTPQSYRLITGVGDQSGLNITDPARFTFVGLTGGDTFNVIDVSLRGDAGGNVFLNFTPVPEPATVLGVGAAVLGLGAAVRRRRTATETLAA